MHETRFRHSIVPLHRNVQFPTGVNGEAGLSCIPRVAAAWRRAHAHEDPPPSPGSSITIEDTGTGLTVEAQANLFTPFFSTKPYGQGIGLTLVQEVLNAHGFQYSLESTPDGPTRMTIICAESHP